MKRIVLILFIAAAVISVSAQPTWTSIASGEWQNPSVWTTSGGATGAPPPTLTSNMRVIVSGHSITLYSTLQLFNNTRQEIANGGRLRVSNYMFYQSGANTLFKIDNGSFEASGSNYTNIFIRIDQGVVDWSDAIVRSGGLMYVSNIRATLNNTCVSSGSWIQWLGVGLPSNYSTMNNVGLFAGAHTQNSDQLIISNSYINLNAAKFFT